MAWNFEHVSGGVTTRLRNVSYASMDLKLDGMDSFKLTVSGPNDWQTTNLVGDQEVRITGGNHALYGYIKNRKRDTRNSTLILTGLEYATMLQRMMVNVNNTASEDATLSSGYRVVYTSTAFATIANDVITNSGFTAGTIDAYGAAISTKFEDMYIWDALKWLANYANVGNVPYDLWVDTSKQVQLQDRRGRTTPVIDFREGDNCTIMNYEGDTIRRAQKVIVRGSGSGSAQISGEWPAAYTPAQQEIGFYSPNITDTTMATQLAHNIYDALNTEITYIELKASNPNADVQLGDEVNLIIPSLGITSTQFRVTRLFKEYRRGSGDSLTVYLSATGNKQRKKTLSELYSENSGLQRLTGSASKGEMKTLTFSFKGKTHGTNKGSLVINLSTADILADSDILGARLRFRRVPMTYDVDANTQNATTNAGITNVQTTTGAGVTNVQTTTNAGMTNVSAGGSSQVVSTGRQSGNFTCKVNSWEGAGNTLISSGSSQGSIVFVNIGLRSITAGTGSVGLIRCRISDGTDYYPDSSGLYMAMDNVDDFGTSLCFPFWYPKNLRGKYIYVEARLSGNAGTECDAYYNWNVQVIGEHTHSNTFDDANHTNPNTFNDANHTNPNTFNDANHANPQSRSVYAPGGEAQYNFNYDIDGTYRGVVNNINVNSDSGDVDIFSWITTRGQHVVEIYPTGATEVAWLMGEVQVDYWSTDL